MFIHFGTRVNPSKTDENSSFNFLDGPGLGDPASWIAIACPNAFHTHFRAFRGIQR